MADESSKCFFGEPLCNNPKKCTTCPKYESSKDWLYVEFTYNILCLAGIIAFIFIAYLLIP